MMILVGVTVSVVMQGGLFDKATIAVIKQETATMQEYIVTKGADMLADKAKDGDELNVTVEEILQAYGMTPTEAKIEFEGEIDYISNVDIAPEGTCYLLDASKLHVDSSRGNGTAEIGKDIFVVDSNKRVYYIIEGTKKQIENPGGDGGSEGVIEKDDDLRTIGAIEDLVDIAIAVNSGETFEGETVTLLTSLDFSKPESYRTKNPDTTPYTDEEGNGIDVNGDGIVEPIKTELTTGIGFPCIGTRNYSTQESIPFKGNFDGNGNTLLGLYINITEEELGKVSAKVTEQYGAEAEAVLEKIEQNLVNRSKVIGLFGVVESGENETVEFKNLTIENANLVSDAGVAQAPIAFTVGDGNFSFSNLNIKTSNLESNSQLEESCCAGIVGMAMGTGNHTFTECNLDGFTIKGGAIVAGLIGMNQQKIGIEISKCNIKYSTLEGQAITVGLIGSSMNVLDSEEGNCNVKIKDVNIIDTDINGMYTSGIGISIGAESSTIENCHILSSNINGEELAVGFAYAIMGKENNIIGCSITDSDIISEEGAVVGFAYATMASENKVISSSITDTNFKGKAGIGGFVGVAEGIKNFEMKDSFIKGGTIETSEETSDFIGGLIGYCIGDYDTMGDNVLNITGCSFEDVEINSSALFGGICGDVEGVNLVNIDKCYNKTEFPGGGAGILLYSSRANVVISNCYNRGRIELDEDKVHDEYQDAIAAGIYGVKGRYSYIVEIQNCFNTGHASGGIIHEEENDDIFVTNCYDRRYGLVGIESSSSSHATITNCHELTGEETPEQKATVLSALNSQVESNNAEEDVIEWSTWVIDGEKNQGYPIFDWAAENWGSNNEDLEEPFETETETPEIPEFSEEETDATEILDIGATINGEAPSSTNPFIPAGFKAVNTGTASWNATNTPDTANGLVIADANKNQFIWVPVSNINEMAMCKTCGSSANSLNTQTAQCTNCGENTILVGKLYSGSTVIEYLDSGSREPAALTLAGETEEETAEKQTQYENNYKAMIESVAKYGGFYIGRYETSADSTGKAQSKKSTEDNVIVSANASTNGSWAGLYSLQRTYTTDSVQSEMIWGSQYDTMVRWLGTTAANSGYNTSRNPGTAPGDIIKNIYDIYGNSYEWTQESYGTDIKPTRGGSYSHGGTLSIDYRCTNYVIYSGITSTFDKNGSRMTLYIIEGAE